MQLRTEKCYGNNNEVLSGEIEMERRHLEILGYCVVDVPQHQWNSMAMSSDVEKKKLLKSLIYKQLTKDIS